ncbi:MAG: FKBP-type peptidyl-prolyl cis-trans isomerase [Moraxella sp.]|nr:FKBP-type peptidyl-prolyl cis-trans isomerase [Moraxella sp.]
MKPRLYTSLLVVSAMFAGICHAHDVSSGLHHKVIKQGVGKKVGIDDDVEMRFISYDSQGRPLDGTMSGVPVIIRPSDMFGGLQKGLTLMQEGGVYELYIPAHLGYSDDERLAKKSITYRIEILKINP